MEETIIKPHARLGLNLKELIKYRELLFYFAWRDIKVRYKQSIIGIGWAVLQPFILMVVFTLFFSRVLGVQSGGNVPYAVFAVLGLAFWNFFSTSFTRSSNSLVDNQGVITKIYFPRLIPPLSAGVVGIIDFIFAGLFVILVMLYFGITPSLEGLLWLPPMMIMTFITATGPGMFFAALNVKYRDIKQALPFMVQTLLFLTPVIYPVSYVPERYQWLLFLNPMSGIISLIRSKLLHLGELDWGLFAISVASALAMFMVGLYFFKAREREFADII